jgi:serine/threonine protein kinase
MGKDGSGFLHTVLGTESYMAPEIHAKKPYKGNEVDLFAAAIILFIMYAGTPPFNKADTKDAYYKLLTTGRYDVFWNAHSKHKPNKDFFSPEFKDLIARMLAEDPKNRLTIPEIW